ncbi:N-acetylmuramoyl-L-alanine amidase [Streptomyces cinereoruber]|uniref:N-acetylmuramoyl-L-alanine amidase n=1 Tax=Streptomyces cinereoruber TaxID=67260 RepID=UPI00362F1289
MAAPLTADGFVSALRREGLVVVEYDWWRTNNRNHKGPWGAVHGVMLHHTVTYGTRATVDMCRYGHSALPGPLCHGVIAKDGAVHLVGYGRANHAGLGDPDVLGAVIAERRLPHDDQATVDGNRAFYGFECENLGDGEDPWPSVQVEAMEKASAAVCRAHGWGAGSILAHREWQPGKPDPAGPGMPTMDVLRSRAARRLGQLPPAPPPVPVKPVVSLSRLVKAAEADRFRAGTPVSYAGTAIVEAALVDEGLLAKRFLDGHYGWTTLEAMSAWQERCGYRGRQLGQPADGIPGRTSLTRLSLKHAFTIAA